MKQKFLSLLTIVYLITFSFVSNAAVEYNGMIGCDGINEQAIAYGMQDFNMQDCIEDIMYFSHEKDISSEKAAELAEKYVTTLTNNVCNRYCEGKNLKSFELFKREEFARNALAFLEKNFPNQAENCRQKIDKAFPKKQETPAEVPSTSESTTPSETDAAGTSSSAGGDTGGSAGGGTGGSSGTSGTEGGGENGGTVNAAAAPAPGTSNSSPQVGSKEITSGSVNKTEQNANISGCGVETGLFTELLNKGTEIFNGLREIIYIVAGFGILAIAVGGFFGNLNWKWLGAVVIGLMVIASTGEILNMIVGCETYTSTFISDTLK